LFPPTVEEQIRQHQRSREDQKPTATDRPEMKSALRVAEPSQHDWYETGTGAASPSQPIGPTDSSGVSPDLASTAPVPQVERCVGDAPFRLGGSRHTAPAARVTIGLDFGTSGTKVIVNFED